MPLDPDSVGRTLGPHTQDYSWKDCVLYALGVGAGVSELPFVYEKYLEVIPSFGIANIYGLLVNLAEVTGMNFDGIVHGEQDMVFHHPTPPDGQLRTEGTVKDIVDKGEGRGALVIAETTTHHSNGELLFTSTLSVFSRFDGGFGGRNVATPSFEFPDRDPDHRIPDETTPNQAALYRLSGDTHALHIDPEFARGVGFEGPILHGLCSYGFACRAGIRSVAEGQVDRLRRLGCRFTTPLYPGDPIETQVWDRGDGSAVFRMVNRKTGDTVLDRGVMEC